MNPHGEKYDTLFRAWCVSFPIVHSGNHLQLPDLPARAHFLRSSPPALLLFLLLIPLISRPSFDLKRVYFVEYTPFYQMRLYLAMAFQRWHTHECVSDYRQFEFGTTRTTAIRMIDDIAYRGIGVFILHLLLYFVSFFLRNMYIMNVREGGGIGSCCFRPPQTAKERANKYIEWRFHKQTQGCIYKVNNSTATSVWVNSSLGPIYTTTTIMNITNKQNTWWYY